MQSGVPSPAPSDLRLNAVRAPGCRHLPRRGRRGGRRGPGPVETGPPPPACTFLHSSFRRDRPPETERLLPGAAGPVTPAQPERPPRGRQRSTQLDSISEGIDVGTRPVAVRRLGDTCYFSSPRELAVTGGACSDVDGRPGSSSAPLLFPAGKWGRQSLPGGSVCKGRLRPRGRDLGPGRL